MSDVCLLPSASCRLPPAVCLLSPAVPSMRSALMLIMLSMTAAGCLSRNPAVTKDAERTVESQQRKQMIAGPITYVALGDSTGIGVGGVRGGYVPVLFRKLEQVR